MDKIILPAAIFFAFVFSGCFGFGGNAVESELPRAANGTMEEWDAGNKPSTTFDELLSSIDSQEKIECDYLAQEDETGKDLKTKIYIEGDKYKSITWKSDDKLFAIYDGEAFYSWSEKAKKGYKMSDSCANEFEKIAIENQDDGDRELDTFKTSSELFSEDAALNCTESPYVELLVPSDVEFVDQCEQLKSQKEAIRKMNEAKNN